MLARRGLTATIGCLAAVTLMAGCTGQLMNLLNPDMLSALGVGTRVSSLPTEAPGILVEVENQTDLWVRVVVSYRGSSSTPENYTAFVAPRSKSGQMLSCPISEITLGDVQNLETPGARVFLADNVTDSSTLDSFPYIEVDAFGVLLQDDGADNFDCGDGILFTVQTSSLAASGYQTFAYVRPSAAP